jgi:hypothetical protein
MPSAKLHQVHYRAALIISGCPLGTNQIKTLDCIGWLSLAKRRNEKKLLLMFDFERNLLPTYVHNEFSHYLNPVQDQRLRIPQVYWLPTTMLSKFSKSTIPSSINPLAPENF